MSLFDYKHISFVSTVRFVFIRHLDEDLQTAQVRVKITLTCLQWQCKIYFKAVISGKAII